MKYNNIAELKSIIGRHSKFLVTTHTNPDGDAIGSSLALFHYLGDIGKKVSLVVPNLYPEFLSWMPGNEHILVFERDIETARNALEGVEVVFCLDYNALQRAGSMRDSLSAMNALKIMIDHHPQPAEADFDHIYSTTDISSTAELLYESIMLIDPAYRISKNVATCLYVGIMTDTGSFSFACNRPETFRITANLLSTGIDGEWIHREVYDTFSENRLRLLGFSLSRKLVVLHEYATAYIALSARELKDFNYQVGDTEGVVNYALSIKGITMAVLLTERKGKIRLSFRSKGNFSVNEVARDHFNGGGHKNAAGGDSYDDLEKTIEKLHKLLPAYTSGLLAEAGQ